MIIMDNKIRKGIEIDYSKTHLAEFEMKDLTEKILRLVATILRKRLLAYWTIIFCRQPCLKTSGMKDMGTGVELTQVSSRFVYVKFAEANWAL